MDKKSFVLYNELIDTVSTMTDEDAGVLFKMILHYENGKDIDTDNQMAKVAFSFIKRQLDATDEKYLQTVQARAEAGRKGAEIRWQKIANDSKAITNDSKGIANDSKHMAKMADTDTDTDTDTVYPSDIKKKNNKRKVIDEIINLYHECCPSLPRVSKLNDHRIKAINARLEDYTIDELKEIFIKAEHSDFLKNGQGTWTGANFDWIMNPTNICKIAEGCYKNKDEPKKKQEEEVRVAVGYRFNENYQMEPVYDREEWEAWKREHPE